MQNPTLAEKIGQMLLLGFNGLSKDGAASILRDIEQFQVGGVILFDRCCKTKQAKNIQSPAQVRELTAALQAANRAASPLLIAVDYEGGSVDRLKVDYGFPRTTSATEMARHGHAFTLQQAQMMARVLKDNGFNLDFAPVVDVNVEIENPIIGKLDRSFSTDGAIVKEYAEIFQRGLHEAGVMTCYKHFPGHGSSLADSHLGFVDVTDHWQEQELIPYQPRAGVGVACDMIMTAHIINKQLDPSGLPATLSKPILTDLLRHQLKYEGVIITDDMQMKAISDSYNDVDAMVLAINAGADMLIYGNQLGADVCAEVLIERIHHAVLQGKISHQRIDDACQRITRMKQKRIAAG